MPISRIRSSWTCTYFHSHSTHQFRICCGHHEVRLNDPQATASRDVACVNVCREGVSTRKWWRSTSWHSTSVSSWWRRRAQQQHHDRWAKLVSSLCTLQETMSPRHYRMNSTAVTASARIHAQTCMYLISIYKFFEGGFFMMCAQYPHSKTSRNPNSSLLWADGIFVDGSGHAAESYTMMLAS
jgi:hypothetical protein